MRSRSARLARLLVLPALLALSGPRPAAAAEPQDCVPVAIVLWGDGRHDDTKALDAWFHGASAIWADSGAPVGNDIAGRSFRLSSAIYVPAGTGRTLEAFHMLWPERGEIVSGGAIRSGNNPDIAPVASGISIVGGDAGEGEPLEMPDIPTLPRNPEASCATS